MQVTELPAIEWLGYSIDLSRSSTMDLNAASKSVIKVRRIIDFALDQNLREVKIKDVPYNVPQTVRVSEGSFFQGNFLNYSTGGDALKAFRTDASLPARYFAVTGSDNSITLARERLFIQENQYAFYSFTHSAYVARLTNYHGLLNESPLLRGVEDLPRRFEGNKDDVLAAYKDFLQRFGTHVIVSVDYGARFQLNGWASNANASVNAKFATDVKAYFNGIPNGGEYDKKVKSEPQYRAFQEYFQRVLTIIGGDAQRASGVTSDPTDWENYMQWSSSTYPADPKHISFSTIALWTLMSESQHGILKYYGEELNRAFTWILTHPRVYKTSVVFDIESDWAEFNLLTPNAIILPNDANPYPAQTIASLSRVQWGKEHSHQYQRQTLRFFIINDGSPVDFSTSHGSNGAQPRQGRAEALMESKRYLNSTTGDAWNTRWFFGSPVSSVAETLRLDTGKDGGYSWDEILNEYLRSKPSPASAPTKGK